MKFKPLRLLLRPSFVIAFFSILIAIYFGCRYIHEGLRPACSQDQICSIVSRPYYPARHWVWSGIFPWEGGFIPDPHFDFSEPMPFPAPANQLVGSKDAEYQLVDVNPAFNDRTSEILLLIRSGNTSFVYSLDFPKGHHEQAILGIPALPEARVFPYKGNLAILEDFFGRGKGIYLLQLPLKSGAALQLIPADTREFDTIAEEFRSVAQDESVKQQFCKTTNDFASFYEKYAGSCEWSPAEYEANPGVRDYDSFWKQDTQF
jgi:hypothetical protein